MEPQPPATPLSQVRDLFRRGDYLRAYEVSNRAIEDGSRDPELIFLGVLSLARCGATHEAIRILQRFRDQLPASEDIGALEARLMKDQFRAAKTPAEKAHHCKRARDAYLAVFRETKGYFPAINAATLSLLMADRETSKNLAKEVLTLCESGSESDYWVLATRAEAHLLLGNLEAAKSFLEKAVTLKTDDLGSQATTYRQLLLICQQENIPVDTIAAVRPPTVIHYTGHMIHGIGSSPGILPEHEADLRFKIRAYLERERVRIAFGALACGADILVAEEILRKGGELHLILPFGKEEFKKISVAPAGEEWCRRFDQTIAMADSVFSIVEEGHCDQELLFKTSALGAMGSAILRSKTLGAKVSQLALWNGQPASGSCGTAADMATWQKLGFDSHTITIDVSQNPPSSGSSAAAYCDPSVHRELHALVFADIRGFSSLRESETSLFMNHWFKVISGLLEQYKEQVAFVNTWGDAVFFVVRDTKSAARIALELAETMKSSAWDRLGIPVKGIRVSAHAAPIFVVKDPILKRPSYFGMHVNKTARMEPCTPVGHVYVTEEFAALLTIEAAGEFNCEYAGEHTLPKNFGKFRMYHLAG